MPDAQSNYERMLTLLLSILSGVNFLMHGLGILESYLTRSYEQLVIDLDLMAMIRRLAQPLDISAETLALETIDQVGPGGHFLAAAHPMRHYRQAHFLPQISLRQPYEQWAAAGGKDAVRRANERCRELLAGYKQPASDSAALNRLDAFIDRRKREAQGSDGAGEPGGRPYNWNDP